MIRIAIAGKGGSGKTTVAGTLARLFARAGHRTLAVDADPNANLALVLGLSEGTNIPHLPADVLQERVGFRQGLGPGLAMSLDSLVERYGVRGPDGVGLLVMGGVERAGTG